MSTIAKPPCDEAIIRSRPCSTPCKRGNEPWILLATILGTSMAFIDGTVVNVALPVLQKEFQATVAEAQWVVESYSLFLAALILVGGSLGDHYGRKRIFGLGILIFTLASIGCGLAQNVTQLIFARAFQGIGGALLTPGSLAIISASFSEEKRGKAIGTWSGFTAITTAIGPVLGGWLVEYASWRWIFFINIPIAIVVLVVLVWRVPESYDEQGGKRLDWIGSLLVTLGLGLLVYGLIEAGLQGLGSPIIFAALVIGTVSLVAFVVYEARTPEPMLPLSLFRSHTFSGTNLLTLFLYAALGAALFFIPFNLIQVQGYSTVAAGAATLPFVLLIFLLSHWSGGLVDRYGAKRPLILGPAIVALAYVLFALPGVTDGEGSYWWTFFPPFVVLGLGMAISVAPLTTAVMGAVERHQVGVASGVSNAVARTAGLLAIAVLGIVMIGVFVNSLHTSLDALPDISPETRQQIETQQARLADIEIPSEVRPEVAAKLNNGIDQAFINGFRVLMFIAAGLALISSLCAWLLIEGKQQITVNKQDA